MFYFNVYMYVGIENNRICTQYTDTVCIFHMQDTNSYLIILGVFR